MKRTSPDRMMFHEFEWVRPFEIENVQEMFVHLSSFSPQVPIALEARGHKGRVRFYIGVDRQYVKKIRSVMVAHGDIRFVDVPPDARLPVVAAQQLKLSRPTLALNTKLASATIRAVLAALLHVRGNEQAVMQIILGNGYAPAPVPHHLPDPHASWLQVAFGNVEQATADSRSAVKEKISQHGFSAVIRLGSSGSPVTAPSNILNIISALRTLNSAGVTIQSVAEKANNLNTAKVPWRIPMRLSVKELSCILPLPAGEANLPGVAGLHPKLVNAPHWLQPPPKTQDRTFALSPDGKKISISTRDLTEHCYVVGPTGSGKSTVLQNMILADIWAGRSVVSVDPKNDNNTEILARIPKWREEDVVVISIDPSSGAIHATGFNPLKLGKHQSPDLLADSVLSVLKNIFSDSWGVFTQRFLSHSIATLAQTKGANLLWLMPLLTDFSFRQKITSPITDVALRQFWAFFENMPESQRMTQLAPVLDRLSQLMLRPGIRNIIGQSKPSFSLDDVFTKKKIVLVSLNKGVSGPDASRLIGSLLVGSIWNRALAQASIPEHKRQFVSIYVDELQDYVSGMSADFANSLAQARGLNVGITMANQHLEQLPSVVRSGIMSNARSKICFGMSTADAKAFAETAPHLTHSDFQALPRYCIYANISQNGKSTGWFSGKTLPKSKAARNYKELREQALQRYGRPVAEVAKEYADLLGMSTPQAEPGADNGPIGRRKRK